MTHMSVVKYTHSKENPLEKHKTPIGSYEHVEVQLSENPVSRYGRVEITLDAGRLQLRVPEGVLEVVPEGSNTIHVQARDPFGEVHGVAHYGRR
jgi:hypothetical protein